MDTCMCTQPVLDQYNSELIVCLHQIFNIHGRERKENDYIIVGSGASAYKLSLTHPCARDEIALNSQ